MVDSWPLFTSNSASSVTCANPLHRQLGTHKVIGWNCGKEMRWDSLFITSPLLSFEKLKNIKAKLFFLLAP